MVAPYVEQPQFKSTVTCFRYSFVTTATSSKVLKWDFERCPIRDHTNADIVRWKLEYLSRMFGQAFRHSAKTLLRFSQNGTTALPVSTCRTATSKAFSTCTTLHRTAQVNAQDGLIEVGDKAYVEKVFTKEDMVLFSDISGDKNPLHLDEDYARTTMFKRPIVFGALTFGWVQCVPVPL